MASGELEQITGHYESGRLFVARAACRRILEHHAVDRESLRQLGLIALRSGDPATAIDAMSQALLIRPDDGEFHNILGNAHRKLGALEDAVKCFRRATELLPDCPEAHNNLGACLLEQGKTDEALVCFHRVLQLDPDLSAAHYNLGNLHQLAGQLDDAIVSYQQALHCDPDYVEAHTNLGAAFFQRRRFAEAIWHYRRALDRRPNNPEALNNLGAVYQEQNDSVLAVDCFYRALELDADYWEARVNLGDTLCDQNQHALAADAYRVVLEIHPELHDVRIKLGRVLKQLGQLAGAEDCYRALVQQLPESSAPFNNLGVVLHLQGKLPDAVACYERALELSATNSESSINLATALREQGEFDRSVECYKRALTLEANLARAHQGLADVLCDRRCLEDARRHYAQAIELAPDDAELHLHYALSLLRMGDFQNGWREFEWRWKTDQFRPPNLAAARWHGEPLVGQTILIHGEQGLGDSIQFVRYLEQVKSCGGEVIFACPDRLLIQLKHVAGVDRLVPLSQPLPDSEWHAPLLSLPSIFRTTLDTIPASNPYLFADPTLVDCWSARLREYDGLKIGVCWHGNSQHPRDRLRSIPRMYVDELCGVPGVNVISLQKESDTTTLPAGMPVDFVDLTLQMDRESAPFVDTAAVMKTLDLVITCDTSLAHLAGALGVRVWVALDFAADWRWLLDRDDSPWYPTMRLFRQTRPGDWADVFRRIRQALEDWVPGGRAGEAPVTGG